MPSATLRLPRLQWLPLLLLLRLQWLPLLLLLRLQQPIP